MHQTALFGIEWLDARGLIEMLAEWLGVWVLVGVAAVILIETAILVVSFLPGDSLLFTLGLLTATGFIDTPIWISIPVLIVAAIIGDQIAFYLGRKLGPAIFNRPKSRFFNPENVQRTNEFFDKHGGKAIILARFLPVFRAFVPVAAGVGGMSYRHFTGFNIIGGFAWISLLSLLGFFLGQISFVAQYAEYFIILIVIISGIPILIEIQKALKAKFAKSKPAD